MCSSVRRDGGWKAAMAVEDMRVAEQRRPTGWVVMLLLRVGVRLPLAQVCLRNGALYVRFSQASARNVER